MKILHVLAQLPQRTGSGIYFTNIIEGLKNYKDVEQSCLYAVIPDYNIDILPEEYRFEVVFETEKLPFSIVGMSDVMPYKSTLYSEMTEEMMELWKKSFVDKLEEAKEKFNPDIIITHHLWILSSIVQNIFEDKKIIGICHNTDIRQAEKNKNIKEKYNVNTEKMDLIFSLSNFQKEKIEKIYDYDKNKIIYLGAGYDEKIFYPPDFYVKKENVDLIYVGKYDESKGIFELLKAFKILSGRRDNITLTLIGSGKEEQREKIEKEIGSMKNIELNDFKPQKEMANILRGKDIFILPSYFEGLGLIAVEALGSGLRAVVTEIPGLIELMGDRINYSGVIEYVKMPAIYNTDKIMEKEKPEFVNRLVKSIEKQIDRTLERREVDREILDEILKNSWKSKVKELYEKIRKI